MTEFRGEIWKAITDEDFHEYYEVSSQGQVRRTETKRILTQKLISCKYPACPLRKPGKSGTKYVHRLVALAFIANPNSYPVVNHKNGISTDNRVENLEWCTYGYNNLHAVSTGLRKNFKRAVEQWSSDGKKLIETFESCKEAKDKTGTHYGNISRVCRGDAHTANGFIWKYVHEREYIDQKDVIGEIVPDFPNYIATKEGKIYSIRSKLFLKPSSTRAYEWVSLSNNGVEKQTSVHRLIAKIFIPNPKNLPVVNHKNLNKRDNRIDNLEWVTASENILHSVKAHRDKKNTNENPASPRHEGQHIQIAESTRKAPDTKLEEKSSSGPC